MVFRNARKCYAFSAPRKQKFSWELSISFIKRQQSIISMTTGYSLLLNNIGKLLEEGRRQAFRAVNSILVRTYWEIGKRIVEYEQEGRKRADYGSKLLDKLSADLGIRHGRGFSRRNILDMRRFYLLHKKWQTVSAELSWSHHVELLMIDDSLERSFYEKQCITEGWSVRELKRQKNSGMYYRIALSKDKEGILELSKKGCIVEKAKDLIKEPYVLEFLNIAEKHSERELEQKIIDNLRMFLLELGKGFTFVARQHRITLNNTNFYVDLVFYHRILRCFVLIDLKIGKVSPLDRGQMNMYLNYFRKEQNSPGDNSPIGIILGTEKDRVLVEYALGGLSNLLFVSKYKLYLPDKKELEEEVKRLLA
jgi:predicted nuclease of restriction endonuclease-like (RecB) superfamily